MYSPQQYSQASACLVLEDGTHYLGQSIGLPNSKNIGELVFNTGLTGYQEILTDPSYAGQIVTLTYPEIGNYGVNEQDNQSRGVFCRGLVIKNISPVVSSWRANNSENLSDYLVRHSLSGIYGVDTRSITRKLREHGSMRSVVYASSSITPELIESLVVEVDESPSMKGQNFLREVSTPKPYRIMTSQVSKGTVVVLDLGLKLNMLDLLLARGYDVQVMPFDSTLQDIKQHSPIGIFLSNGPGDPSTCLSQIELIKQILESQLAPVFGVCLGHQLLSTALGAQTFKLKFGHRGSNHPVVDHDTRKVLITSQNHGFAVDANSVDSSLVEVTHTSLNDQTVEGIQSLKYKAFSVQFHPEACPGPRDTQYLFDRFAENIDNYSL